MSLSEGELYAAHARSSERCRCGHAVTDHLWDPILEERFWCAARLFPLRDRHCGCRKFDAPLPGELAEEYGR